MQNSISKTTIRISGPKFLTDMQYKALGYRTNGYKSVQEVEWEQDSNSVIGKSPRTKWVRYATYSRHVCYPTNFLLGLTAALMTAVRFVRTIVKYIVPLAILIMFISEEAMDACGAVIGIYIITWIATIALMIIAKVIRAAFRIDERMDEICRDNGWMLWSEYNNY